MHGGSTTGRPDEHAPAAADGGRLLVTTGARRIRPIVLVLIPRGRDGAILVQETRNAPDLPTYWQLPGGGLEFGETIEQGARREAREELGAELSAVRFEAALESFFNTPGEPHHELALVCTAAFADPAMYDRTDFRWIDGNGQEASANWVAQAELRAAAAEHPPRLRPAALADVLDRLEADPEFLRGIWAGFRESSPRVRVAARCLFRRPEDGAWLVIEAFDEHKNERFFVIPGGGVQFGESSTQSVHREVAEELGSPIADLRLVTTMENRFVHRGVPGHEIIFIYRGDLVERSLYQRESIPLIDGGESLVASWRHSSTFRSPAAPAQPPLYPEGLLEVILELERPSRSEPLRLLAAARGDGARRRERP
jgi:8-oxo-dGTP pyrophosphatase MutT (NUDIX family)